MKLDCNRCSSPNGPFNMQGNFNWKCAYCSTMNEHVCNRLKKRVDVEFEMAPKFDKQLNSEGE